MKIRIPPRSAAERRARLEAKPENDRRYREWQAANPPPPKSRRKPQARCGPVTITHVDGSTSSEAALTASELRRVAPDRLSISPALRARVLRRDRQTCRYCGSITGPFELDHVLPVALGGATNMRNLVTACATCNRRKGAQVWKPNPPPRRS